jgi:ABC-type transporter lipoprotein component MlaA
MQDGMSFQEAKKQTIDDYKGLRDLYEENEQYEDLNKINKEIDFLKKIKEIDISKEKRNLYEVEIPDPIKKDTPT